MVGKLDDATAVVRTRSARSRLSSASRETTASVLVRRGLRRSRSAPGPSSSRRASATIRSCSATWQAAVDRIRLAVERGEKICVHGDYDVDGICATALAVLTLRELGADVDWHLPSRFDEGYGVSGATRSRGSRTRVSASS